LPYDYNNNEIGGVQVLARFISTPLANVASGGENWKSFRSSITIKLALISKTTI
jgi:hypothetical protein